MSKRMKKLPQTITLWNVHHQDHFVEKSFVIYDDSDVLQADFDETGHSAIFYSNMDIAKENGWRDSPQKALNETIAGHEAQIRVYQGYINTLRANSKTLRRGKNRR